MKNKQKLLVFILVLIGFTFVGCKPSIVMNTVPYEIDLIEKISISFERKTTLGATSGVFCIAANGVPLPEQKTAYNPLQIPANSERMIKLRVYHSSFDLINANPNFNIDKEVEFTIPVLSQGHYTISYLYNFLGGGNKRIALKDSTGKIIKEEKF